MREREIVNLAQCSAYRAATGERRFGVAAPNFFAPYKLTLPVAHSRWACCAPASPYHIIISSMRVASGMGSPQYDALLLAA